MYFVCNRNSEGHETWIISGVASLGGVFLVEEFT